MGRLCTGIFGLDELIGGGFVKNTVNALLGTTGCGKTIFSVQYLLEGLENGEKCVYISFDLDAEEFERIAKSIGWKLSDYIESGQLKVAKFHVDDASFLNSELVKFISGKNLRIVIDSFSPLIASVDLRARSEVGWFFKNLRNSGTAVVTIEEPFVGGSLDNFANLSLFLADSVIHLKNVGYGEIYNRTLRIVKHRMSWHADGVFPYSIIEGVGLVIEERRGEGIEVGLDGLKISEKAKNQIKRLLNEGYLTREDFEKIKRRLI